MKAKHSGCGESVAGDRVIIFAKQPNAGQVKTRLIPAIGARQAAQLHAMMTRHIVTVACASNICPVELWCSPSPSHELFQSLAQEFPISLCTQTGNDLGERMYNAFAASHTGHDTHGTNINTDVNDNGNHNNNNQNNSNHNNSNHNNAAIIVGSDCPALTPAHFRQAFTALKAGNTATLIPALDGGYVLLGLSQLNRRLFEDIQWGTAEVLSATRARLKSLYWTWEEFAALSDIDTQQDLLAFAGSHQHYELDDSLVSFLKRLLAGSS